MKFKKVVIGIVITALLLIVGFGARELYLYYHPEVIIFYHEETLEDHYLRTPMYSITDRSMFGCAKKFSKQATEWTEKTNEILIWLKTECKSSAMNVIGTYEIQDGKTILTYKGIATTLDGETVEVNKEFVFDFVITKKEPRYAEVVNTEE